MKLGMSYKGPTIYTNNDVTDALVENVKLACKLYGNVHVSFDVIGRTCHSILAHKLKDTLGPGYSVDISWNYGCEIKKEVS